MVELVGVGIAPSFGVGWCCTSDPWMTFVEVFFVAVLVGMADVESML